MKVLGHIIFILAIFSSLSTKSYGYCTNEFFGLYDCRPPQETPNLENSLVVIFSSFYIKHNILNEYEIKFVNPSNRFLNRIINIQADTCKERELNIFKFSQIEGEVSPHHFVCKRVDFKPDNIKFLRDLRMQNDDITRVVRENSDELLETHSKALKRVSSGFDVVNMVRPISSKPEPSKEKIIWKHDETKTNIMLDYLKIHGCRPKPDEIVLLAAEAEMTYQQTYNWIRNFNRRKPDEVREMEKARLDANPEAKASVIKSRVYNKKSKNPGGMEQCPTGVEKKKVPSCKCS